MNKLFGIINQLDKKIRKSTFLKFGAPFLILVVGGPFVLQKFIEIRFKYYGSKEVTAEDLAELGLQMKDSSKITLESEYEKLKEMDIDNWDQKRGPRPWEE